MATIDAATAQAQRNFYRLQGRFADSQSQLVSAALLPQPLVFPDTGRWQFEADQHRLIMRAEIHRPSVTLLMKDFNDYHWQPPMLSVKVIGYAAPLDGIYPAVKELRR